MRKTILIICLAFMLVFVVGCNQGGDANQGAAGSKFVGNKDGLTLAFAQGSLPPKVLDKGQPFGITVILANVGDKAIDNGADATVKITGIDPVDFGVSAADMTQDSPNPLRAAQKDLQGNIIQGETISLDFPKGGSSFTHQKDIAGSVTYNVRADVCFKYGTVANTKICVLEDLLGTKGGQGKLCNVNEAKTLDNSGGPVQVASFTESVSSANKVSFVMKITHSGTGTVHEASSECNKDFQKKDKVHVKIDTGISDGLTCSGLQNGAASGSVFEGDTQLLNGEREIRCTQNINSPSDLEKLVTIDLTYDYDKYIEQKLEVQHVGN